MRVQTRQLTRMPSQLHPLAEVIARRDFRWNSETAYAEIDEVVIPEGIDFDFEFSAVIHNPSTPHIVIGLAESTSSVIFVNAKDIYVRDSNGITVNTAGDVFLPGVVNTIKISRRSGNIYISSQGLVQSVGIASGQLRFNALYKYGSGFNMVGYLFDVSLSVDGNSVLKAPLTKYLPNPNIIENKAKPLGSELLDKSFDSYFTSNTYESYIDTGTRVKAVFQGVGFQRIGKVTSPNSIALGEIYKLKVKGYSADRSSVYIQSTTTSEGRVAIGGLLGEFEVELLWTANHTSAFIALENANRDGNTLELEYGFESLRKAEGWGQYIEPMPEDWRGPFELQWNGDWLGQELLVNNDFSQGAYGWSGTGSTTISFSNNQLVYDGDTNQVISQQIANIGIFRISADIASLTRNAVVPRPQFQVSGNSGYQPITDGTLGQHSIDYAVNSAGNTNAYFELGQFGTGAEYKVNSFSVKEVLKSA